MQARVERMTRGKGGRQQTVLAVASQIRSTRASLRGRGDHQCASAGDGGNPPLQALDENVSQRRRRKKGEPRQLDLTGGCTRGIRKARRGRGRGRRGQATAVVTKGVMVGGAFAGSSSSEADYISDGEEVREGRRKETDGGVEGEGTERDCLNVSVHLQAMTLVDQQPDVASAAVSSASQRNTHDNSYHFSTCTTPLRPCAQFVRSPTPQSLHLDRVSSPNDDGESCDQRMSTGSRCEVNVSDMSINNSSILAEGTPSERFNCGLYCTLRGQCNH